MKTSSLTTKDIVQKWYLIDCSGKKLGRLSVQIANILRGYFDNEQEKLDQVQIRQKDFIVQNFSIENTAKSFEKFYINTNNV